MKTEFNSQALLEELIKWDVVGLGEVGRLQRTEDTKGWMVIYWRGKPQGTKQELGVGFLVHERLEKNIVVFYSVSDSSNNSYNLENVQVYAPIYSYSDEEINRESK